MIRKVFTLFYALVLVTAFSACKKSDNNATGPTQPTATPSPTPSPTFTPLTNHGVVTTLAGSAGVTGSTDGTGTGASFYYPNKVAVGDSNNIYVGDAGNNKIRMITSSGVVTTYAGTGVGGYQNGAAVTARFNAPWGVAMYIPSGMLYVADQNNYRIRSISYTGAVSTLAGSGASGTNNGMGVTATFGMPSDVAVDSTGNIYVADGYGHMIRKITPAGLVSTLAGTGSEGSANGDGTSASFKYPNGVAVDGDGNVYVADFGNNMIRKITSGGVVSTFAGSVTAGSADGAGTAASFNGPSGVAVDNSGTVYVADSMNNKIRKITPLGVVSTLAGSGTAGATNGTGTGASFKQPSGVAVDYYGAVYVADAGNHVIRKIQ